MNSLIFQVEITKSENNYDALIKTIIPDTTDTPYAIVQLKNNKSLNQVFYNIGINETFKEDNEWWFNTDSIFVENDEENFFDSLKYDEQQLILEKSDIEHKILTLQSIMEDEEKIDSLSKQERNDNEEQLELLEKLNIILNRKVNRIYNKYSTEFIEKEEISEEQPIKDITDYDNQIDWNQKQTSYSNKKQNTEDSININQSE